MNMPYTNALLAWRAEMDSNLKAPYSWLSLAGLFWLDPGSNLIGSGEDCPIRLPERFPERAGEIIVVDDVVSFRADGNTVFNFNDTGRVSSEKILSPDISGSPDYLFLEDIRLGYIVRDGKPAIRIWDPQNQRREGFGSRNWFEINPKLRIEATVNIYADPKKVMVDDIVGFKHEASMDANLAFEYEGNNFTLDAEKMESGAYYIIFKDNTAIGATYPSGRYMVTEIADDNKVVIDFNRAYNPPCAFTDFATCPLPRPENILPFNIEAGEKYERKT
jgi:hypothetical protein